MTSAEQRNDQLNDDELLTLLRRIAATLETEVLTSSAYDDHRAANDPTLPSSSMIRKHFGGWRPAVRSAGLRALGDAATDEQWRMAAALSSLRKARRETLAPLTRASYALWHAALPLSERKRMAALDEILELFGSWQRAINAAAIDYDDVLHPDALWTSAEARAIRRQIEVATGEPLSAASYAAFLGESTRQPLPSWQVLRELLEL
jgi:hypothetical protein